MRSKPKVKEKKRSGKTQTICQKAVRKPRTREMLQVTKPTPQRGGARTTATPEQDVACEARIEKHFEDSEKLQQVGTPVQQVENKPWECEHLREQEEALPNIEVVNL